MRPSAIPSTDDRLVYAIGDVHGRLDLLAPLVRAIIADAVSTSPSYKPLLIFLGDYVDRGPDSAGVIDFIVRLASTSSFEIRALKGNHEQGLLSFLDDAAFGPTWAAFGGGATLSSYGVPPPGRPGDNAAWEAAQLEFTRRIPAAHLEFLNTLELMIAVGDYVFVHAGVRIGRALTEQSERDVLWIRDEFLEAQAPSGAIVVHGHSPDWTPRYGARRIGLDTGAYATGVLTAARLEGACQSIIQARDPKGVAAATGLDPDPPRPKRHLAKIAEAIRWGASPPGSGRVPPETA